MRPHNRYFTALVTIFIGAYLAASFISSLLFYQYRKFALAHNGYLVLYAAVLIGGLIILWGFYRGHEWPRRVTLLMACLGLISACQIASKGMVTRFMFVKQTTTNPLPITGAALLITVIILLSAVILYLAMAYPQED